MTQNGHVTADDRDTTLPPHDEYAEEAVLGSILKSPARVRDVADVLEPGFFYLPRHKAIWAAMLALEVQNVPVDYVTVGDKLKEHGTYDQAGGMMYLAEINLASPTAAHLVHYAKIVIELATYRTLISLSQGLATAAWRADKNPAALMDEMMRRLAKLSARGNEDDSSDWAAEYDLMMSNLLEERERFKAHDRSQGEYLAGWRTGLPSLDNVLLGLKPGDLIYLAARTSVGKSILAQQIALNVARAGGPVLYVSLEMSKQKLMHRAATMMTGASRHEMGRGNVTDVEYDRLVAMDKLRGMHLRWDTSSRTVETIRRRAMRWADDIGKPLALIVVDYVQLLRDEAGPRANRYENVSAASHALKEMAEALQCTVLAPAQVARAVMNRASKMPDLSDLRESGDLEQDADIALGLDRANYHDRASQDLTATLAVLKARDLAADRGRGTHIPLAWRPQNECYGELARDNVVPFPRQQILKDDLPDDAPTPAPTAHDQGDLPF